jgi:D-alanyl-D-alanine carboxypeptidase
VAEFGRPDRPSIRDHMRLASFSKAFSGAVALALVDDGRLSLSDTIGSRLPWLPKAWWPVTLAELLHHTSGLPDFSGSEEFRVRIVSQPHRPLSPEQLLGYVKDDDLQFTPGTRYMYDNSDNIVVALMCQAATGRPYTSLLNSLVFRPLRLSGTSLPRGFTLPAPYIHGYLPTPGSAPDDVTEQFSASFSWASGGMVSTPGDMTAFIRGYIGRSLFSERTQSQQFQFVPGASEPAGPGVNSAGLAVFRYQTACGTVYGHTGNISGYTQFGAATLDGTDSVTVSVSSQVQAARQPEVFSQLLGVETDAVCAALGRPTPSAA